MKKEQKQDFTRRISQCNKGQMIVIIYDIYFTYSKDAKEAYQEKKWDVFKEEIRNAQKTLDELMDSLDFSFELAKQLYSIYVYCKDILAAALYKRDLAELEQAESLMRKLYNGFVEAAKQDTSAPLMSNTQQIYAGYTYGREDVDTYQEFDNSRGFLA